MWWNNFWGKKSVVESRSMLFLLDLLWNLNIMVRINGRRQNDGRMGSLRVIRFWCLFVTGKMQNDVVVLQSSLVPDLVAWADARTMSWAEVVIEPQNNEESWVYDVIALFVIFLETNKHQNLKGPRCTILKACGRLQSEIKSESLGHFKPQINSNLDASLSMAIPKHNKGTKACGKGLKGQINEVGLQCKRTGKDWQVLNILSGMDHR